MPPAQTGAGEEGSVKSPMPLYEFFCKACKKKFTTLFGMTAEPDDSQCPYCGSNDTKRLVSRPARYRTEEQRLDDLADRLESMPEPDSPSEMRKLLREAGEALDDDVSDEMEELFEAEMEEELQEGEESKY